MRLRGLRCGWAWAALLLVSMGPIPPALAASPDTAAVVAPGDTLLNGLVGMWEGQYSGGVAGGVDRLIVGWKYDRKILQLQSRTSSGPRKGIEVIAFIKSRGEGRYSMNILDSSGALATLEGSAQGRGLIFKERGDSGSRSEWALDWSRPRRMTLARSTSGPDVPDEKFEIRYARGTVRKP